MSKYLFQSANLHFISLITKTARPFRRKRTEDMNYFSLNAKEFSEKSSTFAACLKNSIIRIHL